MFEKAPQGAFFLVRLWLARLWNGRLCSLVYKPMQRTTIMPRMQIPDDLVSAIPKRFLILLASAALIAGLSSCESSSDRVTETATRLAEAL